MLSVKTLTQDSTWLWLGCLDQGVVCTQYGLISIVFFKQLTIQRALESVPGEFFYISKKIATSTCFKSSCAGYSFIFTAHACKSGSDHQIYLRVTLWSSIFPRISDYSFKAALSIDVVLANFLQLAIPSLLSASPHLHDSSVFVLRLSSLWLFLFSKCFSALCLFGWVGLTGSIRIGSFPFPALCTFPSWKSSLSW